MKTRLAFIFLAVVALGATAIARHRHQMMKEHISARIDDALEVAKATPAQRTSIYATRDQLFAALSATRANQERGPELDEALALFEADRLDSQKLAALGEAHHTERQAAGDAIVKAVVDAHDTLTHVQRKAIADWAREHRPLGGGKSHLHQFMKNRITAHVDEALDAAKVTAAQRAAVHAALDHVFATFAETHADTEARIEQALQLFEAEKVDPQAVAALRAAHQAEWRKIADAVVQAISDAHDALTAPERQAVAAYVRAHDEANHLTR
jgi:hypothetical protein